MKVKHLLISRVAVKWNHPQLGWRHEEINMLWDDWVKDSIQLYDKYCRPSLRQQTDQDFTLLSLVDENIKEFGNILENEVLIKLKSEGDFIKRIVNGINSYIETIKDEYEYIIVTRIDRDDCLRKDYVSNVKKGMLDGKITEKYLDLYFSYTYDVKKDIVYDSHKYYVTVSPFVSTMERIKEGKIRCVSFIVDHNIVPTLLNGRKANNLVAIQVIHENNLRNMVVGKEIKINYNDFNLKRNG